VFKTVFTKNILGVLPIGNLTLRKGKTGVLPVKTRNNLGDNVEKTLSP